MKRVCLFIGKALHAALLVVLLSVVGMTKALAEDFVYKGLKYRTTGTNTVTLIGHELGNQASGLLMLTSYAYNQGKYYEVTKIGAGAFSGCTGLTSGQLLAIPNSVTNIGNYAFSGCTGFSGGLSIPNSVTNIGVGAFSGCSGLNLTLTIPESATDIDITAFSGTNFSTVQWNAVSCNDFTPTSGRNGPFENLSNLKWLHIGPNVQRIPANAFYGCTHIQTMSSQAVTPPTVANNAFAGLNTNLHITVPCGTTSAYQVASGWSVFSFMESTDCEYYITGLADPTYAGSVSGSGTYNNGNTCTLTATPNAGYAFVVWTENGNQVSTDASYTFTASCDRLLVAHFQQQSYTINVSHFPSAGGSVTGGGNFTYGNQCTVTASANPGFHFVNWTENGNQVSTNATYTFSVTDSRDLVANFVLDNVGPEQIAFTDANVKAVCVANWDTNGDGELSYSEAAAVTSIGTKFEKNKTITSFDEFQYFTGVTALIGGTKPSGTPGLTLQYGAFYSCSNLTSITISENLASINNYAFSGCSGLVSLTVFAVTPPTLGNGVFSNVPKNIPVYVPCAAVNAYLAASGWSEFTNYQGMDCVYHQITATANPTEGGTASGGGSYVQGTSCTLTATANSGYAFVNWTENETLVSTNATLTFNVAAPRTLVANFSQTNPDETIAFADTNVKAICVDNWDTNGDGELSYDEAAAVTDLNYVFQNKTALTSFDELQYYTGITELKGYATTMVLPNHNFLTTYHGDFLNCNSLTSVVIPNGIISIGSYTFKGCSGLATMTVLAETPPTLGTNTFLSVDKDIPVFVPAGTVAAYQAAYGWSEFTNFQEIPVPSYEITATASPSEGGTISGMGIYNSGSSCTLTAVANGGYTFVNWTENGNLISTDADYTFTVTGTRNLVANFSLNSYTVSTSSNPTTGGTTAGEGSYTYGTTCILTATSNVGYTFVNWTENGNPVSTDAEYTFTVTGTRNLVANFSLNSYTVSTSSSPTTGGTTTGEGTYSYGTTCTLTATANLGYTFVNWTENGNHVSTDAVYTFTVTENKTLVANFSLNIYAITVLSNPIEGGSATGGGAYSYGANCTLTATANQGYTFTNWTKNGIEVSTDPIYSFLVTSAETYVANFELDVITQTDNLVNGWNWYSTYIEQSGINGLTMLENSLVTAGVRIQGRNGIVDQFEYQGDYYWYGTLDEIANEQMYKIRTNAACNAVMEGEAASAGNHPITINNGWNWIGFPCDHEVSVGTAMAGFTPESDDVIKGRNGSAAYIADYNMWYGTLNTLEPGHGYMYKSNSEMSKTLVYQTGRGEKAMSNITTENNVFIPNAAEFANNMLVTAVIDINGEELRSDDYELAAFAGDECRGSVKLMYVEPLDRYVAFLTVFGDEEETINYVLTDGNETAWSNNSTVYSSDAIIGTLSEPAVICFGTMGVNDHTQVNAVVFPNPTKDIFNVKCEGLRKIEVLNTYGQLVMTKEERTDHLQIDLSNQSEGVYLLRLYTDNETITRQIIKNKY